MTLAESSKACGFKNNTTFLLETLKRRPHIFDLPDEMLWKTVFHKNVSNFVFCSFFLT